MHALCCKKKDKTAALTVSWSVCSGGVRRANGSTDDSCGLVGDETPADGG